MSFAVKFDIGTGDITGTWSGQGNVPVAADLAEVTEAEYINVVESRTFEGSNIARYMWNGSAVVEKTDPRPKARIISPSNPLNLLVGAVQSITLEIIDDLGQVITTLNQTVRVVILGRPVQVDIVNGIATLSVSTAQSYDKIFGSTQNYFIANPLRIRVLDNNTIGL